MYYSFNCESGDIFNKPFMSWVYECPKPYGCRAVHSAESCQEMISDNRAQICFNISTQLKEFTWECSRSFFSQHTSPYKQCKAVPTGMIINQKEQVFFGERPLTFDELTSDFQKGLEDFGNSVVEFANSDSGQMMLQVTLTAIVLTAVAVAGVKLHQSYQKKTEAEQEID